MNQTPIYDRIFYEPTPTLRAKAQLTSQNLFN